MSVGEELAQRADLPTDSKEPASTKVNASLSRTVWPCLSSLTSMFGEQVSRILRPEVNTSDRVVLVGREQHAVAAWRLAEPVDLLAKASNCWRASLSVSISWRCARRASRSWLRV